MQRTTRRVGRILGFASLVSVAFFASAATYADDSRQAGVASQDQLWRRTVDLTRIGDFEGAAGTAKRLHAGGRITEQVRRWLEEHEAVQAARRELDRADFQKYIGFAKARIERKEFQDALGWTLAATDCAEDREGFLQSGWIQDLVNDSLTAADELREKGEWRNAWQLYSQLSYLFEREPRYKKLEREVLTHLRLDTMFKEENHWEERIEKVRWRDAEKALELVGLYYVEPVDFKRLAESGLEQLLLLAESKSAQKAEGLGGLPNEDDRNDFVARVTERLEQVRAAPSLDRADCVRHFRRVVKDINEETIRLPEELVVNELMRGAMDPLDDFTTIIWPTASEEFEKHTRGDFVGVGISIIKNRLDEVEVVTPLDGTPAYRAGVQAGDIITDANGVSLKGYSLNKVVHTITGPKGSEVVLTIRRNGKKIMFPLIRATVKIQSVKGVKRDPLDEERWDHWLDRERGIGYVRIINFQKNTVEDVDNALSELTPQGLKGLVLDLRGNPGGLLDSAWQLSSLFLKRGDTVVSTKGRIRSEDHIFNTPGNGPYSDIPLVILADKRSASASEIVSGAVRDNGRGLVVGERTFGKFSVQNLIPLGRSGAKLKITTASYYLPNGDSLHRSPTAKTWGVEPDIPVRLVRWERFNIWQMRRDADLLGPPKTETDEPVTDDSDDSAKSDEEESGEPQTAGGAEDDAAGKEQATADSSEDEKPEEDKLPPLDQPDENNRPKQDPQLDTALLLMRITLLGESYPTVATAETATDMNSETARP